MSPGHHGGDRSVFRMITRLGVGGPARQALLLTHELGSRFPTTLAAGRAEAFEGDVCHPEVPVTFVPLVRPVRPLSDARAVKVVRDVLVRNPVALVHTHLSKAGVVGRLAARTLSPRPVTVHTIHGTVLQTHFGPARRRVFAETERALARWTDVFIAISPEVRDAYLEHGIGHPSQYRVVPLGLDLDPFLMVTGPSGTLRARIGIGPDVPLVAIVARLTPIKDHGTLFRAIALLDGVHLAVVGDGELRAALEDQARQAGMADRVHFLGWCDDVPAAVSDADAVALTSTSEGTPVALIEALAAGRPVVATDVGGVRFVVRHGVTGLLAPVGDPGRFAEALGQLLRSPALGRTLGQQGRTSVAARFGKERLVADIATLYEELLGSEAPSR